MLILKQPLLYVGSKGEKHIYTLFDSGANLSCIHLDIAEKICNKTKLGLARKVKNKLTGDISIVEFAIVCDFYINDVLVSDEFLVVPGLSEDAIIGAATMQKWRIKLDFEHDIVIVDPKVAKMQLI